MGCLPGDGQKKARLIHAFAERYFCDNASQGWFPSADAALSLSMGIFMIHTALHNPSASKDRITVNQWIALSNESTEGFTFDSGMLSDIYGAWR